MIEVSSLGPVSINKQTKIPSIQAPTSLKRKRHFAWNFLYNPLCKCPLFTQIQQRFSLNTALNISRPGQARNPSTALATAPAAAGLGSIHPPPNSRRDAKSMKGLNGTDRSKSAQDEICRPNHCLKMKYFRDSVSSSSIVDFLTSYTIARGGNKVVYER